jgi:peptidoglycan/LPS O-acetylase OafA/YrhL
MRQLDTIRALAAGMVILSHWAPGVATFWLNGHVGVQLFFVISGYLITGILLDARQEAERVGLHAQVVIQRFYIRRVLRIVPLYYATLAWTYAVGFDAVRNSIQWHIPYLSNVFFALRGEWFGEVAHFWSLAVEEQFYFVWPWVILFASKRWLLPLITVCIAIAVPFRYVIEQLVGLHAIAVIVLPVASLDTLGMGALFAVLERMQGRSQESTVRAASLATILGSVGLLAFMACHLMPRLVGPHEWMNTVGKALLAPAALGIVYPAARGIAGPVGRLLAWEPLIYLGKISYGLYIFHFFVPAMTSSIFARYGLPVKELGGPYTFFLLNLLVLVLLSSLSWHLFEK